MYNRPDSFQDVLRELEANVSIQPRCEEAQALNSCAAENACIAELLKAQKTMQAYPYIDEGTRILEPVYTDSRITAAEGPNFSKIPELKTSQPVVDLLKHNGIKQPEDYVSNDARQEIARLRDTIKNWEWAVQKFRRANAVGSIDDSVKARNRLFDMLPPAEKQQPARQQAETKDAPPTLHIEWMGVKLTLTSR